VVLAGLVKLLVIPRGLAVPEPVVGAGLLLIPVVSESNVKAVIVAACTMAGDATANAELKSNAHK